jgi:hypothetical protein
MATTRKSTTSAAQADADVAKEPTTDVEDAAAGSVIPDAEGNLTVDKGTDKRDPLPSPIENRDSVRNADDRTSTARVATEDPDDVDEDAVPAGAAGYMVSQFDQSAGDAAGNVLSSLAYPSKKAVEASIASARRAKTGVGSKTDDSREDPDAEAKA